MTDSAVLGHIDRLIAAGTLEKTTGFYPLVRRPAVSARDAALRTQISELGARRDAGGVPFLVRVLAGAERDEQRRLAAVALGEIGDASARPGLAAALEDGSDEVRRAAADALERIPAAT